MILAQLLVIIYIRICLSRGEDTILQISNTTHTVANGGALRIVGVTELIIWIGEVDYLSNFVVVKDKLPYDIILSEMSEMVVNAIIKKNRRSDQICVSRFDPLLT